jgi:hypothetical protein
MVRAVPGGAHRRLRLVRPVVSQPAQAAPHVPRIVLPLPTAEEQLEANVIATLRERQRAMWEAANALSLDEKLAVANAAVAAVASEVEKQLADGALSAWPTHKELRFQCYREAAKSLGYQRDRVPLPKVVEYVIGARWPDGVKVGYVNK